MANANAYYRPYLQSDSELSDSDQSWISEGSSGSPTPDDAESLTQEEGPNFAALANALKEAAHGATEAAGPSLVTISQEDAYGLNRLDPRTSYSPYIQRQDSKDASGNPLTSEGQSINTVIILQSRNRDKLIYPQPTNCQLFLPRTYRNITAFSIVQLNLTSAFFYFSPTKNNVAISIQEQGRTTYLPNSTQTPTDTKISLSLSNQIRPGSYAIDTLLAELNTQLNRTPLFYDFINGFTQFASAFAVNGDYSLNFNEPGDTYYDAVSKTYITSPTREMITGYYFQARYALAYTFTNQQITNAYYYPVLKEAILDPDFNAATTYALTYPNYTTSEVIQYLIYSFTGLDDPVATAIINANIARLDTYRLLHTYRYFLVNKYVCTYDPTSNRVSINTPALSTSLSNLLITQYNGFLSQQLVAYKISLADYNALTTTITGLLSAIQSMYDYIQVRLATYFAINYGTYSRSYFTNSNNSLSLRPGLTAKGISLTYNPAAPIEARTTDYLVDYQTPPPYYWPYMSGLCPSNQDPATLGQMLAAPINMGSTTDIYPISSNFPYSLSASNLDFSRHFVDASGSIYTDARRRAGDILVPIQASKYTVFKFRSKFRQTLQVETLPRQTEFRYPAWNAVNPVDYPITQLYDISYSYIAPTGVLQSNIIKDISYNAIYGWSTMTGQGTANIWNTSTNFSATFTDSSNFWSNRSEKIDVTNSNGRYYRFIAPYPVSSNLKGSNVYTYPYQVSIVADTPTSFEEDYYAFFYHDVTALAADTSLVGIRNENPNNYKYKLTIQSNTSSNSYSFKAYAGQNYYMILRSASPSPTPINYKVIPFCPAGSNFSTLSQSVALADFDPMKDPLTMLSNFNAAKLADPAFIRLPTLPSSLADATPATIQPQLSTFTVPIGYDASGVSTDLTDYIPFAPFSYVSTINPLATYRIDPTNDYVFQYNRPYDTLAQTYFPPATTGPSNAIFNKNAAVKYTPKAVTARQYKIANYYATTFIQNAVDYSPSNVSSNVQPYGISTTTVALGGYTYTDSILTLGGGLCGFTFLPGDGTWAIDRITIKTNFINANTENSNVHCIGVFYTSDIYSHPVSSANLSNAVGIFLRVKDNIYNSNSLNLGFDSGYGTYHTFSNYFDILAADSNLPLRKNFKIAGFSQSAKTLVTDVNGYYSAIAFTLGQGIPWNPSNPDIALVKSAIINGAEVCRIQNIVGSPIAYPFACSVSTSSVFYDGTTTPTGADLVISSPPTPSNIYGPTVPGADESVSVYEQSIPNVNSHMHFLTPQNIISDPTGFSEWARLSIIPDYMHASVEDKKLQSYSTSNDPNKYSWHDGYALMQGPTFSIVKYKIYTQSNAYTQPDRNFTFVGQIAVQQIFPDGENTSLIAVSGNSTHFVFLGSSNSYLRFKEYDPITGILTELTQNPFYTFDATQSQLQHFVYNDSRAWFISAVSASNKRVFLTGAPAYEGATSNVVTYSNTTLQMQTQSELQIDQRNVYFSAFSTGFTSIQAFSLNSNDAQYIGLAASGDAPGYLINLDLDPVGSDPFYTQFTVATTATSSDFLLLNKPHNPYGYYKIRSFQTTSLTTSNTRIDYSTQLFKNSLGQFITPKRIFSGANGSRWILSDSFGYIMGNRNDIYDSPVSFSLAWQIFFPTLKIEMRQLTVGSTAMADLTGITYPEWPHTMMFAYSNYASLSNDIYENGGKWGLESNFYVSDVSFNGFYYNSYMMNVPLQPSSSANAEDYYIAIRAYLPVEAAQVMVRFSMPNRYDYGLVRLADMVNEVALGSTSPSLFNPGYLTTLQSFDSNFILSNYNFGSNATQNLPGSNITTSNFGDFLDQYNLFYNTFLTASSNLNIINSNVKESINQFIGSNLQYILPADSLVRQRFIAPILSKLMWSTMLTPIMGKLDDEWGLGWNLGFAKKDTDFTIYHTSESFFKIQDDYIYLRLNPEFNINRLDAGAKEDYMMSREGSGVTSQYYCKLLLTSFGGNATTFIHNPVTFNPPINRITKLQFIWTDANGNILNNNDSEWDMTVNLSEYTEVVSIPTNMPFPLAQSEDPTVPATLPADLIAAAAEAAKEAAANDATLGNKKNA